MKSAAATPESYLASVPEDRRAVVGRLRALVLETVPGATEQMQYGMLGYAYEGRPFAALASQKNYVALYLMDLYTQPGLREAHAAALSKLDVGKSCIRFSAKAELPMETFRAILACAPTAVVTSGTLAAKTTAKVKVAGAKTKVASAKTKVASAKTKVASAKAKVASVKTKPASAKTKVASAKTKPASASAKKVATATATSKRPKKTKSR